MIYNTTYYSDKDTEYSGHDKKRDAIFSSRLFFKA